MKLPRRQILRLVAGAAAVPVISRIAWAQDYPNKPVRLIVGFPAGNAPDIIARLIGQWLSDQLGQQFIIENRPGAASNIATEAAVSAPADGYTLLLIVLTNVLNQALYSKLKFDFIRDVSPVAIIANAPFVLIVTPGANRSGAYRSCQSQSGQDQHGVGRKWRRHPCVRGVVQDDGWGRPGSRPLSQQLHA
jgi:tripartite-type tricarboxylate transporter receptor subunit TctC